MTMHKGTFEHLGIKHEQKDEFFIVVSQAHFAAQLKEIADQVFKHKDPEIVLSVEAHASCRSLLGGVAWLTQTRPM